MFSCNRWETKQIMEGKACGVVRQYGESCPHLVGGEIVLTSAFLDKSGREIPFAKAQVVSVRPGLAGEFRRDKMLVETDGYSNGEHWHGQMRIMFGGIKDTDQLWHLTFRITEMDKQAGTRGDVMNPPKARR